MKCEKCGHQGLKKDFPFLYRVRLLSPESMRQCPKCGSWGVYNDIEEERKEKETTKTKAKA